MYKINKYSKLSNARLGTLSIRHGKVATPFFMPVATQGAVKRVTAAEMKKLKAQILLANTYHLMLRPGSEHIKKLGGLHRFMGWDGPILTDSGGFQVFSLSGGGSRRGDNLVRLGEQGAKFRSYVDGSRHYLTPERSLKIQHDLGVDIAVCLDQCVSLPARPEKLAAAVNLTTDWARRTRAQYQKLKGRRPLLFAVIQGGTDRGLRLKSLRELGAIGFHGYNIGGLAVGEPVKEMYAVLDYLVPAMPADRPRYLMGVGYPENIVEAVRRGVDMFDCVIPTREGRHGRLFFWKRNPKSEILNPKQFYEKADISKSPFKNNKQAINEHSVLPELREYSLAYLHYLFKIGEPLGQRLATLNNLEFYLDLMRLIRSSIRQGLL
jgi:queuine tRNA-ribosyltransferase